MGRGGICGESVAIVNSGLMEISNWKLKVACITAFLFVGLAFVVFATDFSSTDYKVSAPVLNSGEYSTSGDYQLFGSISQIAIGTSTITGYQVVSGFLYFPVVTAPVPSATAGAGQVSLTWSAATAAQGWSIGGYNVGQSTTAGGPYTYSASLGNLTSSTRTGLTNGTTYYFIVRAEDALGYTIATSSEVSAVPVAGAAVSSPTPVGGGGILRVIKSVVEQVIERIFGEEPDTSYAMGDLNYDDKVDIADFSILTFWYGKQNPPRHVDVSGDGSVGLRDFSMVAFYWTGSKPVEQKAEGKRVATELYQNEVEYQNVSEGPYVLGNRDHMGDTYVKAVDRDGQDHIAALLPAVSNQTHLFLWIGGAFIMAIVIVLWRYRKFRI